MPGEREAAARPEPVPEGFSCGPLVSLRALVRCVPAPLRGEGMTVEPLQALALPLLQEQLFLRQGPPALKAALPERHAPQALALRRSPAPLQPPRFVLPEEA